LNNGWDTYDSAIVAAPDEATARTIHPSGYGPVDATFEPGLYQDFTWVPSERVVAKLIGVASEGTEQGLILASFKAG
jgi:hypothetical protein